MKNIIKSKKYARKKTETGQKPVKVDVTPTLKETVVYSWGRMNPPTKGHEKLVQEMQKVEGDKVINLSHSEKSKRNPLSYDDKLFYAQEAFGDIIKDTDHKNISEALIELGTQYKNIVLFVGEDRAPDFKEMFEKSNDKHFHFEHWEVISAGNRRPDSDDVSSISSSLLREACISMDDNAVLRCLPESLHKYAQEITEKVQKVYDLHESIKIVQRMRNKKQVDDCKKMLLSATKMFKK